MSDESANPDIEILNAARPALATTAGPLIAISSPYARRGALWDTYRRNFGPEGDPSILVARGTTREFNPDLPQSIVDRALDRDHAAASTEYLAEFRTDVEGFIAREAVDACVTLGVRERPPVTPALLTRAADHQTPSLSPSPTPRTKHRCSTQSASARRHSALRG